MEREAEDELGFFRGLIALSFMYAVGWGIYQWGYINGADAKLNQKVLRDLSSDRKIAWENQ